MTAAKAGEGGEEIKLRSERRAAEGGKEAAREPKRGRAGPEFTGREVSFETFLLLKCFLLIFFLVILRVVKRADKKNNHNLWVRDLLSMVSLTCHR